MSPPSSLPSPAHADDPLRRARQLGESGQRKGALIGLLGTGSFHAAILLLAFGGPPAAHAAAQDVIDVDILPTPAVAAPPPPVPEAPAPEPEPTAAPPPRPPNPDTPDSKEDPYEDLDAPSRATEILTAPESAPEPETTIASGDGTGPGFGLVAGDGTGNTPTFDPRARIGAHRKSGPPTTDSALPTDRSRPPSVVYGLADECEFPPSADTNSAVVTVIVDVGPDGRARGVDVLSDPGQGFAAAARACVMRRPFRPGLDFEGRPTSGKTGPVRVRFTR